MRVLAQRQFDMALRDAVFLPDGDLLVARAEGLMRVMPDTRDVVDAWPFGGDRLRTGAGRRLVMLSWGVRSLAGARAGQPALTAGRFEWPAITRVREIAVADHHVTLSPGGDRYAVEIQSVARSVSRVVVYDTDTGHEVARRRADFLWDKSFIDDGTLALAGSGTTPTVPVELWNVPGPSPGACGSLPPLLTPEAVTPPIVVQVHPRRSRRDAPRRQGRYERQEHTTFLALLASWRG